MDFIASSTIKIATKGPKDIHSSVRFMSTRRALALLLTNPKAEAKPSRAGLAGLPAVCKGGDTS